MDFGDHTRFPNLGKTKYDSYHHHCSQKKDDKNYGGVGGDGNGGNGYDGNGYGYDDDDDGYDDDAGDGYADDGAGDGVWT